MDSAKKSLLRAEQLGLLGVHMDGLITAPFTQKQKNGGLKTGTRDEKGSVHEPAVHVPTCKSSGRLKTNPGSADHCDPVPTEQASFDTEPSIAKDSPQGKSAVCGAGCATRDRPRIRSMSSILEDRPVHMRIINLRFNEGMSQQEISVVVGLSQPTVHRYILEALASLRLARNFEIDFPPADYFFE